MRYNFALLSTATAAVFSAQAECKADEPTTTAATGTSSASFASGSGWPTSYTATASSDVAKAAATAKTSSPTSSVKGKSFDRFVIIWNENTDYEKARGDPNLSWFADRGILLTNQFAVTHPSEPNYFAAVAGDYFGMQNDDFNRADANVSTVFDLLDTKGVSWSVYQEDMPYSGYEGMDWKNQKNGRNDYVRKHNPPIFFDSVTESEERLSQIKNISMIDPTNSMFHKDLKADKLPQWMFITPNMTSDGHDTSVTVAGQWTRDLLEPLLDDPKFMKNTLVLITFDENETYSKQNRIHGVLIGDVIPEDKIGTTDSHFYNHYSELSSVQANWDLPSLGRWDVGANVYEVVTEKAGGKLRGWCGNPPLEDMHWNQSYAGFFNTQSKGSKTYPAPNLDLNENAAGNDVLESIKDTWEDNQAPSYYKSSIKVHDGQHPPKGYKP